MKLLKHIYTYRASTIFCLILVISGFILFGQEFITLWAGDNFRDAYWMAIIPMLAITIGVIQSAGGVVLQVMNQYGICARLYTCIGIINFVLANLSGRLWSGIGCACTMGAGILAYNLLMTRYYKNVAHIDVIAFWKKIRKITLVGGGLAIGTLLNTVISGETLTILDIKFSFMWFCVPELCGTMP